MTETKTFDFYAPRRIVDYFLKRGGSVRPTKVGWHVYTYDDYKVGRLSYTTLKNLRACPDIEGDEVIRYKQELLMYTK